MENNNTSNTLETRKSRSLELPENVQLGGDIWSNPMAFNTAYRMAQALAASTIIPKEYQGNASNTLIALEMAGRMGASPMQVMQNLYIVNGRPAWSSQYIIAVINSSRKYRHELKFELTGSGEDMSCYAWTCDQSGERLEGPVITMKMAKDEDWLSRNGSKWKTMPEVMMRYRAAAFFGRLYCSDMIMGIYTAEEVIELPEESFHVSAQERAEDTISKNANAEVIDAETITQADTDSSRPPSGAPAEKADGGIPVSPDADGQQTLGKKPSGKPPF